MVESEAMLTVDMGVHFTVYKLHWYMYNHGWCFYVGPKQSLSACVQLIHV